MTQPWEKYQETSAPWEKYQENTSQDTENYSGPLQAVRSGLQGLTFGLSDEVGAALAAIPASIQTGEKYSDAYSKIQNSLKSKRQAFSEDYPKTALGLEVAGGVLTGGAGGARALGGAGYRNASNLGKAGRISGVGAAEGAVYGAGSADQGERVSGAVTGGLTGAVAAPVAAGAVNALGRGAGAISNYSARKLAQTPKDQAVDVLRDTADSIGMTADDAVEEMARIGPEGTIADLDDAFAVIGRAGMNRQGTMRGAGREMVDSRQAGQQQRLKTAIRSVTANDETFRGTYEGLIAKRAEAAAPLYDAAFKSGLQPTAQVNALIEDPLMKRALATGRTWATSEGRGENLMVVMHYAKQNLDDQIGKAVRAGEKNKARLLQQKKQELMAAIRDQNPEYIKAAESYAGESQFINALETGRDFLKIDPEDLATRMQGMTEGEVDLVRLGAARAIGKKLDTMGTNRNATSALLRDKAMRDRLALVMDDPESFLRQAGIEEQFSNTRNMLTGNSTTAMQQQAGQTLDRSIDSGMAEAVASANPSSIISGIIRTVSQGRATPEMINELGQMMFRQGMSEQEIRRIFTTPAIKRAFGDQYDEIIGPVVRASTVPALMAGQSQTN